MNEDRESRMEDRVATLKMPSFRSSIFYLLSSLLLLLAGCHRSAAPARSASNRVVLYCSVDDVYAKPIIQDVEKKTGLRIDTLYDTEAAKTAGLANRIRAERNRPQGDVFWSSALLQTLLLKREGLLQAYQSPAAQDIPPAFKDPQGAWTGMGARARLIVFHKQNGLRPPRSLQDLIGVHGTGISNPQFGSASDWVAALAARWGVEKTLNYFRSLSRNGVRSLPGNSVVAEKVAHGELQYGVTDTDDFLEQSHRTGTILTLSPPAPNTVLVPVSVAMLKGAPHPEAARKLIDALCAPAIEQELVMKMPGVLPLRSQSVPKEVAAIKGITQLASSAPNDTARWPAAWDAIRDPLAQILLNS
ncbi:MAG: substrate-binding domain-containing protein [Abitibacteriaceae bacterium]|nr:substrate-binding domain-containing protein [Abditibacteriaceae bacterium]MBV9866940.1 substrate-binding domain-containing protein [Abditibacteriaceae bacterium]